MLTFQTKYIAEIFNQKDLKDLLETPVSLKLKTSNNEEPCRICGNIHPIGYNDPKNQLLNPNNNEGYEISNPKSSFTCEYCYFINKSYRRTLQRDTINKLLIEKINQTNPEPLLTSFGKTKEYLQEQLADLDYIKSLEVTRKSKAKKISKILETKITKDNIKKSLTDLTKLLFDYEHSYKFATFLKEEKIAALFNKTSDIGDILLINNDFVSQNYNNTSIENDLLKIFKNPPKTPFMILKKESKGSTIINMAHKAKPTIHSESIVVNHGCKTYVCNRTKTLQALKDAIKIQKTLKENKIKASEDVLFNGATSSGYNSYLTNSLRNNPIFSELYKEFISKYNSDIRTIAKCMLKTYQEEEANQPC